MTSEHLSHLRTWFVRPLGRPLPAELQYIAENLACLQLATLLVVLPLALVAGQWLYGPLFVLLCYGLNRLAYPVISARLTVYGGATLILLAMLQGNADVLIWLIVPLLFSLVLFSLREHALFAALLVLAALLLPGANWHSLGLIVVAAVISLLQSFLMHKREDLPTDPIERILGEQEQTFRMLIENSPDFVYIWRADTDRIPYFNRDGFLGYTREELATPGFLSSVIHEEDWPALNTHWQAVLHSDSAAPVEYRVRHKQGHWEWLERQSTMLVEDTPDDVVRVLIVLRLITARKAREIELRQQEARNRALLGAIPDMIVRMDHEGYYRDVWPFKEARVRRSERFYDQLVGKHILDVLDPVVAQQILDCIQLTLDSDETQSMTYELNEADGRRFYEAHWVRYGETDVLATIRDVTSRKEDEARLQREASIFRHVVEAIIVTEMIDNEPHIVNMNQAAQDLYGWSLEEARGKTFLEVIRPQYAPSFPREKAREVLTTQGHWASEVLHHHRDGRVIPVYNSSSMWFDAEGQPRGVVTISLDLTQQKEIEAALKMAEDRFHTALKGSSIVVSNQDRDLRYTWMHDSAPDFVLEAVIGKTDRELYDDSGNLEALKQQVLDTAKGLRQEISFRHGGEERHYQLTIEPLRDAQDRVTGITCVQVDITETVEREAERRRIQSLLQTLIDNVPIVVWALDKDGTITLCEGQGLRLLGQDSQDISGQSAYQYFRDDPRMLYSIERTLDGESFTVFHERENIQFQTHFHPFYDPQGKIDGLVAVTIDLSERTNLERNRLDLALERERITMLQRFMGDVSHDFKTPLTSIKLSLHLLSRAATPEDRQRHLDVINMQASRLENFMSDLFNMSRFDRAETNEFNFAPINFNQLIGDIILAHQPLVEEKQHLLTWEPGTLTNAVLGDRIQLDRVLTNLLVNAIVYTPAGGEIMLRTEQRDSTLLIEVQDNGPGIPAEHHERIFQRFYRGDPARNTERGGMGLGLAIARKIIEAHNGKITLESTVGKGTTFRVTLPCSSTHRLT